MRGRLIPFRHLDPVSLKRFVLPRYGLGTCYLRMSKIRLAEFHYRKAVEIHPNNAVLLGCVGMVCFVLCRVTRLPDLKCFVISAIPQAVERRGDRDAALAIFDEAVRLAPDNALVRYRRAKILIAMKRYAVCLKKFCRRTNR
jgi:anaphase-promoting complex subunit 3